MFCFALCFFVLVCFEGFLLVSMQWGHKKKGCSLGHYSPSEAATNIEYFRSKPELFSVNFLIKVLPEGVVRGVPQCLILMLNRSEMICPRSSIVTARTEKKFQLHLSLYQ